MLAAGPVDALLRSRSGKDLPLPALLQITGLEKLKNGCTKLKLSDGKHWMTGYLRKELSQEWVESSKLKPNYVVSLEDCIINTMADQKIAVVNCLSVSETGSPLLGKPTEHPFAKAAPPRIDFAPPLAPLPPQGGKSNPPPFAPPRIKSELKHVEQKEKKENKENNEKKPKPKREEDEDRFEKERGEEEREETEEKEEKVEREEYAAAGTLRRIHPYDNRGEWSGVLRVIRLLQPNHYQKEGKEGVIASADFVDAEGTEIGSVMYGSEVRRLYPVLQVGCAYTVDRARVKPANPRFARVNHIYELAFLSYTRVADYHGRDIPEVQFRTTPIAALERVQPTQAGSTEVDVLGIVVHVSALKAFDLKTKSVGEQKRSTCTRTVVLVDASGCAVDVVLWGETAQQWSEKKPKQEEGKGEEDYSMKLQVGDVLLVQGCHFQADKLRLHTRRATLTLSPLCAAARELAEWYKKRGARTSIRTISKDSIFTEGGMRRSLLSVDPFSTANSFPADTPLLPSVLPSDAKPLRSGEQIEVCATVIKLNHNESWVPWYMGCTQQVEYESGRTRECGKKIDPSGAPCLKCGASNPVGRPRYIVRFWLADATNAVSAFAFDDHAKQLFGMPAERLEELHASDPTAFQVVLDQAVLRRWNFTLRVKPADPNFPSLAACYPTQYTVVRLQPVDYIAECHQLLSEIAHLACKTA